ncbi:MAG: glycosyltransferase family 4 protein [Solirubrobacterales bacterium]|nr:glycosyltransferase family 4 protein [Solirubrobacterales bacterium]
MKVVFDARPGEDIRGIGRYVRCLLPALRQAAGDDNDVSAGHRPGRTADVFHAPWIDGALLRAPCPQVVTVHDVIPLKRRSEYLRTGMRFRLRYLAVSRAQRVVVPTQAVAADAVDLLGLEAERLAVVPEAPAPGFTPRSPAAVAAVLERHGLPKEYLLWVGALRHPDPRKRVATLAAAPRELPLVLVGRTAAWARELPGVILTGEIDDEDLAALYTGARALVFPSDDEGFGLPPVEALACGTPVVASDVPVLREVLGDRATFVDAADVPELVAAAQRATRPAPPPPAWSWEDAALATWRVYEEALAAVGEPMRSARRRAAALTPDAHASTTITGSSGAR